MWQFGKNVLTSSIIQLANFLSLLFGVKKGISVTKLNFNMIVFKPVTPPAPTVLH